MAQKCNQSAKHRFLGMSASAAEEVALVENPNLQCVPCVRGRDTRPGLRRILVSVEITTLSQFNVLAHAANGHILLAFNLKVFRMVLFDMFKSPAV